MRSRNFKRALLASVTATLLMGGTHAAAQQAQIGDVEAAASLQTMIGFETSQQKAEFLLKSLVSSELTAGQLAVISYEAGMTPAEIFGVSSKVGSQELAAAVVALTAGAAPETVQLMTRDAVMLRPEEAAAIAQAVANVNPAAAGGAAAGAISASPSSTGQIVASVTLAVVSAEQDPAVANENVGVVAQNAIEAAMASDVSNSVELVVINAVTAAPGSGPSVVSSIIKSDASLAASAVASAITAAGPESSGGIVRAAEGAGASQVDVASGLASVGGTTLVALTDTARLNLEASVLAQESSIALVSTELAAIADLQAATAAVLPAGEIIPVVTEALPSTPLQDTNVSTGTI